MFPLRRISGFCLRCLLLYALFVVPWPGLLNAYRQIFGFGGNVCFAWFGSSGSVSFQPLAQPDHEKDMAVVLTKQGPRPVRGTMQIKSVYAGYRPTAFLVALVLATPVPWRRRLFALFIGLVLVNCFIVFRLSLLLLNAFTNANPLALFSLSGPWKAVLFASVRVLYHAPAMHYIAPAFIWLLVTFRRDDLRGLLARGASTTVDKSEMTADVGQSAGS